MAETVKDDDINSLCKKYFTPELCDEPVTESKAKLKNNLLVQLVKYGDSIVNKVIIKDRKNLKIEDFCLVVINTIEACMKKWAEGMECTAYSAYFYSAVKRNCINKLKTKEFQTIEYGTKLDATIDGKTDSPSIGDFIKDNSKNYSHTDLTDNTLAAEKRWEIIDRCFRARQRADWWKSILTGYFYEDLHKYANFSVDIDLNRYSFIDKTVYAWEEAPSQKKVAQYLGKDEGQLSKALKVFLDFIKTSDSNYMDK